MTPCVHTQERHNMIKAGAAAQCPWCELDMTRDRLRRAEALLADAVSLWDAQGAGFWRQQMLRHAQYQDFLKTTGQP